VVLNDTNWRKQTCFEKNLAKLKELNVITRVGSDKTGHWKIITNGGN